MIQIVLFKCDIDYFQVFFRRVEMVVKWKYLLLVFMLVFFYIFCLLEECKIKKEVV